MDIKKISDPKYADKSLVTLCSDVDNARISRNILVHNKGIISLVFFEDALPQNNHPFRNDVDMCLRVLQPLFLKTDDLLKCYKIHTELLHILHDTIQKEDFGETKSYIYARKNEDINWSRLLLGL